MRKIIILIFIIFTPFYAFCNTWGLLRTTHEAASYRRYLIYKFLKSDSIAYCTYGGAPMIEDKYLSLFFEASFRYWTLGTAKWLEKSERRAEFEDIIQTLNKPFTLNYMGRCGENTKGKVDIEILSDQNLCNFYKDRSYFTYHQTAFRSGISICILEKQKNMRINSSIDILGLEIPLSKISKKKFAKGINYMHDLKNGEVSSMYDNLKNVPYTLCTMLHETGHAFGLADEYSSQRNHDPAFSSPYRGEGIMNNWCTLSADDITAMIALTDKNSGKERTFRPLDNLPGMIKNGQFLLPEDTSKMSEEDFSKLKRSFRISRQEYKDLMDKYGIDFKL